MRRATRLLLAAAAALTLALALGAAAYAQATPTPPTAGARAEARPAQGRWLEWRLRFQYRAEKAVLRLEQRRLEQAKQAVPRIEARIGEAKDAGKDTAKVEAALATFKAALPKAEAAVDMARGILTTHAGFADDGKVTDAAKARETVREAGKAERTARQALVKPWQDLREAVREYLQFGKPSS